MLELVFKYILKNNYQSYYIPFWFEAHCTRPGSVPDPSRIFLPGPTSNFFLTSRKGLRHVAIMYEDGTTTNLVLYMVRNDTSKKGGDAPRATD